MLDVSLESPATVIAVVVLSLALAGLVWRCLPGWPSTASVLPIVDAGQPRGAYMITVTPSRQIAAPIRS